MPIPEKRDWHWSDITQEELIGRLFPLVGKTNILLEGMIPGCYWEPWKMPPDKTALDEAIKEHIIDEYNLNEDIHRSRLKKAGIFCPYYAWRAHTAIAANHASVTCRSISPSRRDLIQREIDNWHARINISKILARQNIEYVIPAGSIHLKKNDLGISDARNDYALRKQRIDALHEEIKRDEEAVITLENEILRINAIIGGKTGYKAPDYWKTPFFIYLSNLWKSFSGKEVPFNNIDIKYILTVATSVISGGDRSIGTWSLTKTLKNEVFSENVPEQGFRLGESDFFDLDNDKSFYGRGQAMVDLGKIFEDDFYKDPFASALAFGAIYMRDFCGGSLAVVVRELLLRRGMNELKILPPRAALQLGWLKPNTHEEIKSALRVSVAKAKKGDLASACVLELACAFDDTREIVEVAGWKEPFGGYRRQDFERELARRDEITPEHRYQDGDHKAFRVAMAFVEISAGTGSSMLSGSVSARLA